MVEGEVLSGYPHYRIKKIHYIEETYYLELSLEVEANIETNDILNIKSERDIRESELLDD
jgi:hypothetical protein